MKTEEIASRLVALCREQKWETAQRELFSPNAVSIEPEATGGFDKETRGLPAIIEKGRKFVAMVEQVHSISVSDPLVAPNSFACTMRLDMTMKGQGHGEFLDAKRPGFAPARAAITDFLRWNLYGDKAARERLPADGTLAKVAVFEDRL